MDYESKWSPSILNAIVAVALGALLYHQVTFADSLMHSNNKLENDIYHLEKKVESLDSVIIDQTKRIDTIMNMHPYKTSPRK